MTVMQQLQRRVGRLIPGTAAGRAGLAIAALALIVAALAACGSDETSVSGGAQSLRGESVPSLGASVTGAVSMSEDAAAAPAFDGGVGLMPANGGAAQIVGRSIIRNGAMELQVESVGASFERIVGIANAAGGFVADSSFFGSGEQQGARLTLRVPAERFDAVVSELRGLAAEVLTVSTSSQDVTGELTDLGSQLRNLRAVETQYLMLLDEARTISEILQVQDRLNQTRFEIDRTEGRIQLIERLADLATINVDLQPLTVPIAGGGGGGSVGDAAANAWAASLETLNSVARVVVVAAVYSWWLLPLLVVALVLARRFVRSWERARPPQPLDS